MMERIKAKITRYKDTYALDDKDVDEVNEQLFLSRKIGVAGMHGKSITVSFLYKGSFYTLNHTRTFAADRLLTKLPWQLVHIEMGSPVNNTTNVGGDFSGDKQQRAEDIPGHLYIDNTAKDAKRDVELMKSNQRFHEILTQHLANLPIPQPPRFEGGRLVGHEVTAAPVDRASPHPWNIPGNTAGNGAPTIMQPLNLNSNQPSPILINEPPLDAQADNDHNRLVPVCGHCQTAECWQREETCGPGLGMGFYRRVSELDALALEDKDNYSEKRVMESSGESTQYSVKHG